MTITLTEKAVFRLRAFLLGSAKDEDFATKGIRVSVNDGG